MENTNLGKCCICKRENETVRNVMTLDVKIPDGETKGGWGCFVCGLEPLGAVAVLCDECLEKNFEKRIEIKFACLGYPGENRRVELEKLTEVYEHDLSKHPEEESRAAGILAPGEDEEISETTFIRTGEKGHHFIFVCEGCGASGELTVPLHVPRFSCPVDCGAGYVVWRDQLKADEPALMCVIRPVFEDEDEDDDIEFGCEVCGEWNRCDCFD